jgi:hypothetical protein
MRGANIDPEAIESIAAAPESQGADQDGNCVLIGTLDAGHSVEIVIALDDPDFVITVIPRRTQR